MNASGGHDTFTVINGPEDGTEFVITQRSVTVGADPTCAVNVRLDGAVLPIHGRMMAVGDGYRIRAARNARVLVNGQRVGVVRSKIVRHGDIVRLGETDLALTCTPGGLAQRSRGTHIEGDLFWATREAAGFVFGVASRIVSIARGTLSLMRRHPFWTAAGVIAIAYWRVPAVHSILVPVVRQVRALI